MPDWGILFFGGGFISWIVLESLIIHRLMMLPELAPALRTTLGIHLAPPAVGCVAYLSVTGGPPDMIAQMLFGYALFQAAIMIRLIPWLREHLSMPDTGPTPSRFPPCRWRHSGSSRRAMPGRSPAWRFPCSSPPI